MNLEDQPGPAFSIYVTIRVIGALSSEQLLRGLRLDFSDENAFNRSLGELRHELAWGKAKAVIFGNDRGEQVAFERACFVDLWAGPIGDFRLPEWSKVLT